MLWFHFLPPRNGGVGNRVHRGSKPTPPNKKDLVMAMKKGKGKGRGWHGDAEGHAAAARKSSRKKSANVKVSYSAIIRKERARKLGKRRLGKLAKKINIKL